ncbi:MAG TPA: CpsD/CapB family tyrosine-protein kinase [Candidatus Deferrimicrobium sp.]
MNISSDPMFVEQFKSLSSRFEYRIDMLQCKVVAITSAVAGEGKTVSAVNLATNLAASGRKKVLLVDVDLRKCDLAKEVGVSPVPGLSEYLAGPISLKEILQKSPVKGLVVIPGGMRIAAPWELLSGERFRTFHKAVREHFDVVLLDTPPVIPVSDTHALRDLVDGFVLVYRLGHTPHPMFKQAMDDIGEKKLLGVVLNGVERQTERYYQRYYGKYYVERTAGETGEQRSTT